VPNSFNGFKIITNTQKLCMLFHTSPGHKNISEYSLLLNKFSKESNIQTVLIARTEEQKQLALSIFAESHGVPTIPTTLKLVSTFIPAPAASLPS